ncbi:histone deacetylase family protein (plasmid) [Mesorhizobium sp. ORM8.1]
MKVCWNESQLLYAPRVGLQTGELRPFADVPRRATALLGACHKLGLEIAVPAEAPRAWLETVHDAAYLDFLRDAPAAWMELPNAAPELIANVHPSIEMRTTGRIPTGIVGRLGWYTFDASCPLTADTWAAILASASCALGAACEACEGRSAYALIRPPGHHAYRARAGGACFVNNAALAAERLRAAGAARVAILDIDAHHGNGTQGLFWERSDIFCVSLHGNPDEYYPWYTGHSDELGIGAGAGYNLNMPLKRGADDAVWLEALDAAVASIKARGAEALVVSLGFDAHQDEPMRFLSVTDDGFANAGEAIGKLGLPTAIVQEGGYNLETIGGLLERFLDAFAVASPLA